MAKIRILKIEVIPLFDKETPILYEILSSKSDYLVRYIAILILVDIDFNGVFGTVYMIAMLELIRNTLRLYLPAFDGQIITALDSDTLLNDMRRYIVRVFKSDETFKKLNVKIMGSYPQNDISFSDFSNFDLFDAFDIKYRYEITQRLSPQNALSIMLDRNINVDDMDEDKPPPMYVNGKYRLNRGGKCEWKSV